MKLTLPNIQKMDFGEGDSIRLNVKSSKKAKSNKNSKLFEDLLKNKEDIQKKKQKRIKQGENFFAWKNKSEIQNQQVSLRRKDAVLNPRKDTSSLNISFNSDSKSRITDLKNLGLKESQLNFSKKAQIKDFVEKGQKTFSKRLNYIQKSDSKSEVSKIRSNDSLNFRQNDKFESIDINSNKGLNDLTFFDNLKNLKENFKENEEQNSLKPDEFNLENGKSSSLNDLIIKGKAQNIDQTHFDFDLNNFTLNNIFSDSSFKDSKFVNPILRHLANNISQNYSYSLEQIMHSFDSISFKNLENGFTLNMRLFPEELGELKLHLKKEGQNISLIAFVMNEEAKQVMQRDTENLSNFLFNQGYNLENLMVEVKNEGENNNFDNFGRFIAETRNFIKSEDFQSKLNETNSKNQFQKYFYSKGIGRLINKSI